MKIKDYWKNCQKETGTYYQIDLPGAFEAIERYVEERFNEQLNNHTKSHWHTLPPDNPDDGVRSGTLDDDGIQMWSKSRSTEGTSPSGGVYVKPGDVMLYDNQVDDKQLVVARYQGGDYIATWKYDSGIGKITKISIDIRYLTTRDGKPVKGVLGHEE